MPEKSRMIIVDDSPLFRVRMTNFLKTNYSFEIEEYNSARELVDHLNNKGLENVLLIILDQHLPDGNGLTAIKEYKAKSGQKNIPFILVSANISKDTVTRAFAEGAKDVIAKPVNHEKLKERIDIIISPQFKLKQKKTIMDYYKHIMNETKRARRGNYSFSIVLAGIFEKHGLKSIYKEGNYHQVIDLEQNYPQELQKVMRDTDTIVSLSPSEYLFILPFTDVDGTGVIKEKVNDVFLKVVAEKERSKLIMVTGVATYPDNGDNTDNLILKIEEDFKKSFTEQHDKTEAKRKVNIKPVTESETKVELDPKK